MLVLDWNMAMSEKAAATSRNDISAPYKARAALKTRLL